MNKEETEINQYLFFILEDETYAVNSLNIREIVDCKAIRKVPNVHKSVLGITNIRGELLTIIDPKIILSIKKSKELNRSSFVIFKILNKEKTNYNLIGLMVDKVIEIEEIETKNILKKPELATKIDKKYIENIIHNNDSFIIALNIEKIVDIDKLSKGNLDE